MGKHIETRMTTYSKKATKTTEFDVYKTTTNMRKSRSTMDHSTVKGLNTCHGDHVVCSR